MTRKAMSIIGRIIGLLLVVAIAFIATWCIANPAEAEAEWNKIFNKTPQQEQPDKPDDPTPDNPTPDDPSEGYNLDGIWYYTIPESEDIEFVEIQGTNIRLKWGFISDNKIYISLSEDYRWYEGTAEETDETYAILLGSDPIVKVDKQTNKIDSFVYETAAEMTKVTDFEIHEHTFGEAYVAMIPTCTKEGYTAHRCTVCGLVCRAEILPTAHREAIREITEATCTSEGQREIYCQDCLEVLRTETIPAKGHSYSLGICETCGMRNPITHYEVLTGQPWTNYDDPSFDFNRHIIESIFESGAKFRNMDNHEEIYTIQKYQQSTDVGTSLTTMKIIDPQGYVLDFGSHNIHVSFFYNGRGLIELWSNGEMLEPNTSLMGFYTGNNGRLCFYLFGNAQLEYYETDNHYFVNGTCSMCGEKDPNFVCGEHIFTTREYGGVCEICGYTITCHHENQYVGYSEAATCESEGYELYFCSDENCICHDHYAIRRATLPALGHDYVNGVCSRCGETISECQHVNTRTEFGVYILEITTEDCGCYEGEICDHNHVNSLKTYCSDCGLLLSEVPNIASHSYVDGVCSECGWVCDHNHTTDIYCASNCESQGFSGKRCDGCGYESDMTYTDALGHDYVDGVCSRCHQEVALTWVLNDTLTLFGAETKQFDINFVSNNQSFKSMYFTVGAGPYMRYLTDTTDAWSGVMVYSSHFDWKDYDETDTSAYKTVTFETAPSGDLLAWLQANATPQS